MRHVAAHLARRLVLAQSLMDHLAQQIVIILRWTGKHFVEPL
jgi:hypothetical protein